MAERLRLVRNAEERKKKEKLHRLLAEGAINIAVQKTRRPLASPGELTAEFDQHRGDLELLLATELGGRTWRTWSRLRRHPVSQQAKTQLRVLTRRAWRAFLPKDLIASAASRHGAKRDERRLCSNLRRFCVLPVVWSRFNRSSRRLSKAGGAWRAPGGVEHLCFPSIRAPSRSFRLTIRLCAPWIWDSPVRLLQDGRGGG